ncbi:MAG: hypothetical protein EPO31_07040 [Gammaproteobacteria bacterium]|nr:MAG: hypothetical protein EPO31_07040 [Gammaproteobacteria bacterium]
MSRLEDLVQFYDALSTLEKKTGGKRKLSDCNGRMQWPLRGVYFFFEEGEHRTDSGYGLRVSRVGTHALKENSNTTLWQRLSQHRGVVKSGGGNHRGSIFRKLVGEAIINRETIREIPSWGIGFDHTTASKKLGIGREVIVEQEQPIEGMVSNHIREMPFLFIGIDDNPGPDSERGYIERNAIALLSNWQKDKLDASSSTWLGQYSGRRRVRDSGIWNNNHVDEPYDSDFVDKLIAMIHNLPTYLPI